jgi:hypothetical protein
MAAACGSGIICGAAVADWKLHSCQRHRQSQSPLPRTNSQIPAVRRLAYHRERTAHAIRPQRHRPNAHTSGSSAGRRLIEKVPWRIHCMDIQFSHRREMREIPKRKKIAGAFGPAAII